MGVAMVRGVGKEEEVGGIDGIGKRVAEHLL